MCADQQPLQTAARGDLPTTALREGVGEIAAGAAQCGIEAGEQSSSESADKGVEENAPVEADLFRTGKRFGEVVEELDSASGEHKAEDGAQDGEQQHFTQQLRDDGAARCAEREAEGDLALAVGSAGEQQRGDIDAGDEQQEVTAP